MKELEVVALVVEAFRVKKLVVVALVAVKLVKNPVVAERRVAKKLVDDALVRVEDAAMRFPVVTRPVGAIEKKVVPVDDATLKIVLADPDVPWILKEIDDDVAPTPSTVPLSIRVDVPRVLLVAQRVA
jgi:hypothetical protein